VGDDPDRLLGDRPRPRRRHSNDPSAQADHPQFTPTKRTECEWQLLEDIAKDLPRGASGRVDLYTEWEPCTDCQNVISQFVHAYPGVKVNVSWG
jgi:hypothetical protein